jgi:hypothetical protein
MTPTVKWLPKPGKHDFQAAEDNKHVASDLRKAASGAALSPILLLRGDGMRPLVVADGYHRVCASYWIDENTDIPCILVDPVPC